MPYSVFFTKSGVAFHGGGDVGNRTAGCIRLANADARYFFDNLNVGDAVEVVDGGSADYAPSPAPSRRPGGGGLLGL
jgi:L,D-transpeptidase catalytic domain